MNTHSYDIKADHTGPVVSRVAWRMYRYIIQRMRTADYPSCWLSDCRLLESAGVPLDSVQLMRQELKAARFMNFKTTDFGAQYMLPTRKKANE